MWTELLSFVGIPVIRSFAGWIENAFKDGKIEAFEWKLLGSTILRVGVLGVALWLGLNVDPLTAAGIAVVADFGISTLRKIGN